MDPLEMAFNQFLEMITNNDVGDEQKGEIRHCFYTGAFVTASIFKACIQNEEYKTLNICLDSIKKELEESDYPMPQLHVVFVPVSGMKKEEMN